MDRVSTTPPLRTDWNTIGSSPRHRQFTSPELTDLDLVALGGRACRSITLLDAGTYTAKLVEPFLDINGDEVPTETFTLPGPGSVEGAYRIIVSCNVAAIIMW